VVDDDHEPMTMLPATDRVPKRNAQSAGECLDLLVSAKHPNSGENYLEALSLPNACEQSISLRLHGDVGPSVRD